jgi:hypothetical protein
VALYLYFPNTPSGRGALLETEKKSQGQLYVYTSDRRLGRPQIRSRHGGEQRKHHFTALPGNRTSVVQPILTELPRLVFPKNRGYEIKKTHVTVSRILINLEAILR